MNEYFKGDIIYCDLTGRNNGRYITKGRRLCIVISNDKHNQSSHTLTVIPMSSKIFKSNNVYNIFLDKNNECLREPLLKDNICLISQMKTISKEKVFKKIGRINTNSKFFKFLIRKVVNFISD